MRRHLEPATTSGGGADEERARVDGEDRLLPPLTLTALLGCESADQLQFRAVAPDEIHHDGRVASRDDEDVKVGEVVQGFLDGHVGGQGEGVVAADADGAGGGDGGGAEGWAGAGGRVRVVVGVREDFHGACEVEDVTVAEDEDGDAVGFGGRGRSHLFSSSGDVFWGNGLRDGRSDNVVMFSSICLLCYRNEMEEIRYVLLLPKIGTDELTSGYSSSFEVPKACHAIIYAALAFSSAHCL